jgi:hypothetical protein
VRLDEKLGRPAGAIEFPREGEHDEL